MFSFRYKDFREVDGEEDEVVLEVAGSEVVPELDEDGLGFEVVPEPEGDPAFEPVEAELGPAVRELAVERAGSVQDGQGVLRLAEVVQVPGEVVLGAEEEPSFLGGIDEHERLADVDEAPFGVDVADGVANLEEGRGPVDGDRRVSGRSPGLSRGRPRRSRTRPGRSGTRLPG